MIRFTALLALLFMFSLLSSCTINLGGKSNSEKSDKYSFNELPRSWVEIEKDVSDFAAINESTGASIIANSNCQKYLSDSLEMLNKNLFLGIDDLIITKKSENSFQGREALEVHATGKVDGIVTIFRSLTTKKNYCVYDFILIMPRKADKGDIADFENFLKGVQIK